MEYYKVVLVAYECRRLHCLESTLHNCALKGMTITFHVVTDESAAENRKRKEVTGIQSSSDSGFPDSGKNTNSKRITILFLLWV